MTANRTQAQRVGPVFISYCAVSAEHRHWVHLLSAIFYDRRDDVSVIPVLRDADPSLPVHRRVPLALGMTTAIDMDVEDWRGSELQTLIDAVRAHRR